MNENLFRIKQNKNNKIYKVYIDKLDDTVNKFNDTHNSTIESKPVDVKQSTYIDSDDDEDLKFKIFDIIRISKYKNIFAKSYVPNWSEEFFVIKKS